MTKPRSTVGTAREPVLPESLYCARADAPDRANHDGLGQKQSPYQCTAPGAETVARTEPAGAFSGRAIPTCSVT